MKKELENKGPHYVEAILDSFKLKRLEKKIDEPQETITEK